MSMDPADRRNELIIVSCTAFFIACCFSLTRHFSGAWAPTKSIDLAVYWNGLHLFFSPDNPYDPQTMFLRQQELAIQSSGVMVWNPPILFAILGPFLSLPFYWARLIWSTVTTMSTILGAYLSWRLATDKPSLKSPVWLVFGLFFCPYLYEMSVEQISSFLDLLLIVSILLFKSGRHGLAGAAAGLLIVKPHMFYLIFLWYFLVSFFEKRWSFYLGFFLSIAFGSILVELLHPGINVEWLTRESWPSQYVGSTLPSLIRIVLSSCCKAAANLPQILIPLSAAIAVVLTAWGDKRKSNFGKSLILSIILCPLTAPYGFVFDQVVLIVPIMVIAAYAYDGVSSRSRRRAILTGLAAVQLIVVVLAGTRVYGVVLSWYPLPLLILLMWIMLGGPRKSHSKDKLECVI